MQKQRLVIMIRYSLVTLVLGVLSSLIANDCFTATQEAKSSAMPDWSLNAAIIEGCSCPMLCQCYFGNKPEVHYEGKATGERFCRFNNAFLVNKGHYGKVRLDGVKFWMAGDLGSDSSKGQMDWAVLTFDPSVTEEQRDGIYTIIHYIFPVKWNSLTVTKDAQMQSEVTTDRAEVRLDGGKTAEIVLHRAPGMTDGPVVVKNMKFWGAPRNDGFILMPSEVEAYSAGNKPFEFKGTSGFMITIDISSKDVK